MRAHHTQVTDAGNWWAALFEAGPGACLDGETSLVASGLEHYQPATIRVSVRKGSRVRRARGISIRETRRWRATDRAPSGIPRSRVEVAAVRAALWAVSDKQAALVLTLVVQQGLTTAERLGREMLSVRRDKRRRFIHAVINDLIGGVRSLGELEVARECRRRGLPEPTRQVLRKGAHGRYYLDLVWEEWNLVVDALRQNDVTLSDAKVLRLPLLGFRLAADDFFAQIESALTEAGFLCLFAALPEKAGGAQSLRSRT